MGRCARAVALWAAVLVAAGAGARVAAYTVDCNHDYTDCETELRKLTEDDELPSKKFLSATLPNLVTTTTASPTRSTPKVSQISPERGTLTDEIKEQLSEPVESPEFNTKPKPRLLSLNDVGLQFAKVSQNYTNEEKGDKKGLLDLSDVNLDEDEEVLKTVVAQPSHNKNMPDKFYSNLQAPFHTLLTMDGSEEADTFFCRENNLIYKIGEKLERGCEEICECSTGGVFECSARCKHPYMRRGRQLIDPLCIESPVDECCSIMACAGNGETKPTSIDICRFGNDTYPMGAKWNVGCEKVCTCEKNSIVECRPRCNPLPPSDKCINVLDPSDACCEVQVCDVSQDVHEEAMDNSTSTTTTTTTETVPKWSPNEIVKDDSMLTKSTIRPLVLAEPIGSVKVLQNNSVQVNLIHMNSSDDPIHLLLSDDGGKTFKDVILRYSNLILNLGGGKDYILKTKETGTKFNFTITASGDSVPLDKPYLEMKAGCYENGTFYSVGEEFHIGCEELCECTGPDTRECATLHCPSHVGLEIVSKGCVRWAPSPPAEPPNCCPRSARCLSDGTCHYKDIAIPNWSEVPITLTGCELRCFCENGELDCQEVCTPLSELPPQTLRCPPMHRPAPVNVSDEDCCKQWGCVPNGHATPLPNDSDPHKPFLPTVLPDINFPHTQDELSDFDHNNIHRPPQSLGPEFPHLPLPGHEEMNKKLFIISLQADSPTSIKMLFGLPPVLVGLQGSVDLRYTDKADEDVSQWSSQVFAPADEVLTTARLEFRLTGLKPSTTYKVRAKLYIHNLPFEPESDIFSVRTQDLPTISSEEEKRREIDSRLTVLDVNDTTAAVSWRHFSEDELQYIDGIQVRFRPVGTPIYVMTELLHHSRTTAQLQDLRPGSKYEASLVLIPPPRVTMELYDPGRVEFTTAPYVDPYNWSVTVEARTVGSEAAELTWRGVPAPAERWVRVYRAVHACQDNQRRENDAFRLAARDLPSVVTLTGLQPDTRCRVWLELFLTNGKVKTSNVLEINTKSLDSPEPIDNEIQAASMPGGRSSPRGDYYGALVIVGVIAALGVLASVLLALIVVRRHRPHSVAITSVPSAPRESSLPPYDNPAYTIDLPQESIEL